MKYLNYILLYKQTNKFNLNKQLYTKFISLLILHTIMQEQSDTRLDQFNMLSVIGKGSYAKVMLVRKKDNHKLYALKSMKKKYIEQKKQEGRILMEKNILK
jgi:serine/threonine protein kinase